MEQGEWVNEVRLVDRVSAAAELRTLPSGDEVCIGRVVVPRLPVRAVPTGRRGQSVDVIDLAGWSAKARRSMATWSPGDEVEVTGAMRRRFYRTGAGSASRVEVEVRSARRLRRAATG